MCVYLYVFVCLYVCLWERVCECVCAWKRECVCVKESVHVCVCVCVCVCSCIIHLNIQLLCACYVQHWPSGCGGVRHEDAEIRHVRHAKAIHDHHIHLLLLQVRLPYRIWNIPHWLLLHVNPCVQSEYDSLELQTIANKVMKPWDQSFPGVVNTVLILNVQRSQILIGAACQFKHRVSVLKEWVSVRYVSAYRKRNFASKIILFASFLPFGWKGFPLGMLSGM